MAIPEARADFHVPWVTCTYIASQRASFLYFMHVADKPRVTNASILVILFVLCGWWLTFSRAIKPSMFEHSPIIVHMCYVLRFHVILMDTDYCSYISPNITPSNESRRTSPRTHTCSDAIALTCDVSTHRKTPDVQVFFRASPAQQMWGSAGPACLSLYSGEDVMVRSADVNRLATSFARVSTFRRFFRTPVPASARATDASYSAPSKHVAFGAHAPQTPRTHARTRCSLSSGHFHLALIVCVS